MRPGSWWRKVHFVEIPQLARILFDRLKSNSQVARISASLIPRFYALRDAIEAILRKEGVRRGLLFGLGSCLILGVLVLLLVRPSAFSPAETMLVSLLILMSVTFMLVMDLFD
jgi:hypothetical protein